MSLKNQTEEIKAVALKITNAINEMDVNPMITLLGLIYGWETPTIYLYYGMECASIIKIKPQF